VVSEVPVPNIQTTKRLVALFLLYFMSVREGRITSNKALFNYQKLCYVRYEKPLKDHPLDVAKKYVETVISWWKRIPRLMTQHEIPRKGYKINNVEHFTIIHTSCTYEKSFYLAVRKIISD